MNDLIKKLIDSADKAIKEERFDDLVNFNTEDAVLVVKPGLEVQGKESIKKALKKSQSALNTASYPNKVKCL